ncbi:MAG TPA: protein phosphatase 2C domain-containing protein [Kofleriaceae bacterium]|jgi:serine/threonine protein phosphatase PrpC
MQLDAFAITISGRRANNEDAICARPDLGLFVVADGMGGYEGGEIASALAVEAIHELVRRTAGDADVTWPYAIDPKRSVHENEMIVATRLANDRIIARRVGELGEMGSTVAVLRFVADCAAAGYDCAVAGHECTRGGCGCAIISHVGDSRIYRMRGGVVEQLTADHSLYNQLVAAGMEPASDFAWRHVVTRALGTTSGVPDVQCTPIVSGDVFLVCSDGLSEVLGTDELAKLLALSPETACRQLVDAAYDAGSRDNISAIVVRAS